MQQELNVEEVVKDRTLKVSMPIIFLFYYHVNVAVLNVDMTYAFLQCGWELCVCVFCVFLPALLKLVFVKISVL